ncbi:Alcohol dehydrogenase superfamily [Macleaya cordata]|uniref:Alcohol dehydrogenase superfamily n=1 Tax=Macleaya cordata TaxID=56857 RepID=A0A200PQG4_MACCD|nr:Alcohol dehydrogenase superfamily [Macleaya cordata]
MEVRNRYVTLKHQLDEDQEPKESDFELKDSIISLEASTKSSSNNNNYVLVQNLYVSIDPYQINRMKKQSSSHKAINFSFALSPGQVIDAYGVGRVVASTNPGFEKDDLVAGLVGWEDYSLVQGEFMLSFLRKIDNTTELPLSHQVGILGLSGLTAYGGFYNVGRPKKGDKVFVSAASGSVGNLVGQYAKLLGCYVVGSAGTKQKVDMLKDKLGFDEAFNYKEESDLTSTLQKYFPDGIDIYFDNVGSETLEAAVSNMNMFGRVVACGVISEYTDGKKRAAPNMIDVIYKRITIQGFLTPDHMKDFAEFTTVTSDYLKHGKMHALEDISVGIESIPSAFVGIFRGKNIGKKMVQIVEN